VRVTQNEYKWGRDSRGDPIFIKEKNRTELVPCEIGRLGINNEDDDYLGISTDFLCPKRINYEIQGVFSGELSKFIQISVKECSQKQLDLKYNKTKKCMNESEIIRVAGHLKLYLVF